MLKKSLGLVLALGLIGSAHAVVTREMVQDHIEKICKRLGSEVSNVSEAKLERFMNARINNLNESKCLEKGAKFQTTVSKKPTVKEFCARLREIGEKAPQGKLTNVNGSLNGADKALDNLIKPKKQNTITPSDEEPTEAEG